MNDGAIIVVGNQMDSCWLGTRRSEVECWSDDRWWRGWLTGKMGRKKWFLLEN
jgi:hypothetical protein